MSKQERKEKMIAIAKRYIGYASTKHVSGWGTRQGWCAIQADQMIARLKEDDFSDALTRLLKLVDEAY